jgi:hypothetical protein
MHSNSVEILLKKRKARPPQGGSAVIWPQGAEALLGISAWTRWNWEKTGKLPPRDVCIAGKKGWRPETLQALTATKLKPRAI